MGIELDQFLEKVDSGFLCTFCSKVLEQPVTSSCGHNFCKACLQKAASTCSKCPRCKLEVVAEGDSIDDDLARRLEALNVRCTRCSAGCDAIVPMKDLDRHAYEECPYRDVRCPNRGCDFTCPQRDMDEHLDDCQHRFVDCKVCGAVLIYKDMPLHQAVKRCSELANRRRIVVSARRLSGELKTHRVELQRQRHATEQAERRVVAEHFGEQPVRRRAQSAGPVLVGADWVRTSIQARVGSAHVVSHYSRNLKSARLDSCMHCTDRFLGGRRASARNHAHTKPCEHCENWKRQSGPRGWISTLS